MNQNSVIVTLAAMIIVAFKSVGNGADVKYQVVDLGTLGGDSSSANDINASGHVVGTSTLNNGNSHAFIWYNGLMQDLGTLGGNTSEARAINDNGQIVGSSSLAGNVTTHAFKYSNSQMQNLGSLGGDSYAQGINNSGKIVGYSANSVGVNYAFLYSGGSIQNLNINCYARDINDSADIVGYYYLSNDISDPHSFLYTRGLIRFIDPPDVQSYGICINNKGQISGVYSDGYYIHPYFYNGSFVDLGTLGGNYGYGFGINYNGDIVGHSQTVDGDDHAFIYSNGEMKDLNDILLDNLGWTLTQANGINDGGQIVGYGINPSGQQHAFLLNPVSTESSEVVANIIPAQKAFGACPVKDPTKNSLVVITHGWQINVLGYPPPNISFVDEMTIDIINNMSSRNVNNWQVFGYKWLTNAWVFSADDALNSAKQEGKHLGESIAAQGWTHVHLIAHSAGAALIQSATEAIKNANSSIIVHETFLDPFVGSSLGGIYTYGRRADWADQYFSNDKETDVDYFSNVFLIAPYTESPAFHSYNVNVTMLDPNKSGYINKFSSSSGTSSGIQVETCTKSTHGWPVDFYMNTITGNTTADYAGFGFSLSEEGGNWSTISGYGVGNGTELNSSVPVKVLGSDIVCTAVTPKASPYSDFIPDFTQSPTVQSITGTIEKYTDHINLFSGSPVWLSTAIIPTNPVNLVSFDAEFTSGVEAQGVLVVLWDTNTIGTLDERFIEPGLQHYQFSFSKAEAYSTHVLGLRLDPFTNVQSSVTLTNVVFNYAGVTQPFSLSITTNAVNNLRVWRLDGEAGFNYNVQASTNLNSSEWTDIAILENTNGAVFFYDADQNIYNQRFYRAVAPY